MLPLKEKILALLIQLLPSLKITEGIENIRQYVVGHGIEYVVPTGFLDPIFLGGLGDGCTQTTPLHSNDATGTISAGQTLTCTIVNAQP
jgi:hypothetical protein